VSLKENDLAQLAEIAARHNAPMQVIGAVGGSRFVVQPLFQLPVEELKTIWATGLTDRLK